MVKVSEALRYLEGRIRRTPDHPIRAVVAEPPKTRSSGDDEGKFSVSPADASAQILIEGLYLDGKRRLW